MNNLWMSKKLRYLIADLNLAVRNYALATSGLQYS